MRETRSHLLLELPLERHELLHVVLVLLSQTLLGHLKLALGAVVLLPEEGGGLPGAAVVVRILCMETRNT